MKSELIDLFYQRKPKEVLLNYCRKNNCWDCLSELCMGEDGFVSWRSAWLLAELSTTELDKMPLQVDRLIIHARTNNPSVQREFFKLIEKLDLPEEEQSAYFDWAVEAWLKIDNPPSTRIAALKAMVRMSRLHPELNREILQMGNRQYLESLSPGIRAQAERIFQNLEYEV